MTKARNTMLLTRHDSLWLWVSGDDAFADDDWKAIVDRMTNETPRHEPISVVVSAGKAPPSAQQRWYLSRATTGRNIKIAVITESALVRGAVTALSWFSGMSVHGFSSRTFEQAMSFLGIDTDKVDGYRKRIEELRIELAMSNSTRFASIQNAS